MFRRRVEVVEERPIERGDVMAMMVSLMRIEAGVEAIRELLGEDLGGEEEAEEDS